MEVWVTGQPHLLYETVELLFAYVNLDSGRRADPGGALLSARGGNPADAGCGLCRYFPG